jgi:hypothetical protein
MWRDASSWNFLAEGDHSRNANRCTIGALDGDCKLCTVVEEIWWRRACCVRRPPGAGSETLFGATNATLTWALVGDRYWPARQQGERGV